MYNTLKHKWCRVTLGSVQCSPRCIECQQLAGTPLLRPLLRLAASWQHLARHRCQRRPRPPHHRIQQLPPWLHSSLLRQLPCWRPSSCQTPTLLPSCQQAMLGQQHQRREPRQLQFLLANAACFAQQAKLKHGHRPTERPALQQLRRRSASWRVEAQRHFHPDPERRRISMVVEGVWTARGSVPHEHYITAYADIKYLQNSCKKLALPL